MAQQKFDHNPELYIQSSQTDFLKSPHHIGRIYSKSILTGLRESSESLTLNKNFSQVQYRQEILLGAQSPLSRNPRLNFQFGKLDQSMLSPQNNNSSILEINPVTNRSFRISKLYSSEISNFTQKKKTPELIGKLSSSKINLDLNTKHFRLKSGNVSKDRSPGHLTSRKSFRRGAKQNITPINTPEISRFMQFIDQNLKTSNQFSQTQLNPENQRLLQEVKEKQQHLKQIIEKRKKAGSQNPVPHKNIQEFKYNYPVSRNNSKLKICSKTSPYLQKIQQNSKLFQGSLVSPKFLSKVKEVTTKPLNGLRKNRELNDAQEILEKSINGEMKISPEVNVSFTIKSPRRTIESDNKKPFAQKQAENQVLEWRQNISRVSLYSPEKNANFNNRKPKFVQMVIDPMSKELQENSQTKAENSRDLSFLSGHFSRSRNFQSQESQQETNFITLKTSISMLKQLLIESMQISHIRLILPSVLFENTKITPQIQIKNLHLFIEKVYREMRIKPEIVTIKRYKNAVFSGVFQSSTKDFNFFTSIIYHFSGDFYVGGWKESRNSLEKDKVEGFKHGIGLEVQCERVLNKEKTIEQNNSEPFEFLVHIYFGQFENNKKHGYGIKFEKKFSGSEISWQKMEIGCWSDDQKHGWVKSYTDHKLQVNSEYEKGAKTKQRALKGQMTQTTQIIKE